MTDSLESGNTEQGTVMHSVPLEQQTSPITQRDEFSRDPESGWGGMSGAALTGHLFGTAAGGRFARVIAFCVDACLWVVKAIYRKHRWWTRATSEERMKSAMGLAFWILCAAVIYAMWTKASHEAVELAQAREFAIRGSCSVCMDSTWSDISKPCMPATVQDFTTHAAKNDALLAVLRRYIDDGHTAITAASAGSRACLLLAKRSVSEWLPGMSEVLMMYNPIEIDLLDECKDETEHQQSPPPPPTPPTTTATVVIKLSNGDTAVPPVVTTVAPPPPVDTPKIEYNVYEEASDFYAGVVAERKRPTPAKFRYTVFDKTTGTLKTKCVVLKTSEAMGVLHGIEVLNTSHYALYQHPRMDTA
jgi:hypothetical protein